ncbi:hypothetical protein LINPERPRIM_LOCUS10939 [Linum perenne]
MSNARSDPETEWSERPSFRFPISDFLGGRTPENDHYFFSYRWQDSRGAKNGIVNISVVASDGGGGEVGDYGSSVAARKKEAAQFSSNYALVYSASPSWMTTSSSWGVSVAREGKGYSDGGVVAGVPVWGAHRS